MKKALVAVAALAFSGGAFAAPFVNAASWTVSKPSEVKRGGSYADGTFGNFTTFNPLYSRVSGDIPRRLGYYASFFTLDVEKREYVPYVAESYTLSANKRVWTFKIRPEAKWSDGKPIVADDYVLSTKINQDEKMETQYYDEFFKNDKPIVVTKVDDRTVRVTFPTATVDEIESLPFPLPAHIFGPVYASGKKADLEALWSLKTDPAQVVSMGPWVIRSYRPGERVTFAKNPTYGEWNKDSAGGELPYLDGFSVEFFKDANANFAAFLAGKVDNFSPRNADDLAQIKKAVDGGQLKAVLKPNVSSAQTGDRIAWNWNRKADPWKQKLFRDSRFRRAMSHLMNRAAMVSIALGGTGQAMYDYVPPLFKTFTSPNLAKFDFNPEGAAKILSDMGFKKKNADGYLVDGTGKVLEFDVSPNAGNNRRAALSQVFSDEAKKIGVKANVRPVDAGTWSEYIGSSDKSDDRPFDSVMYGIVGGGIILPFSEAVYDCRNGTLVAWNQSGKCIAPWETTVVNLLNKAQSEFDAAKRKQLVFQIQDISSKEQPVVYLVSPNYHAAWTSRLHGEFPTSIQDAYVGDRSTDLSWVSE
jgi:peptide/nickel transport system substrate-binding protein